MGNIDYSDPDRKLVEADVEVRLFAVNQCFDLLKTALKRKNDLMRGQVCEVTEIDDDDDITLKRVHDQEELTYFKA